jgi:hypothetical protein
MHAAGDKYVASIGSVNTIVGLRLALRPQVGTTMIRDPQAGPPRTGQEGCPV